MNVKGILVEGSDGNLYLVGIGARTGGAQAERPHHLARHRRAPRVARGDADGVFDHPGAAGAVGLPAAGQTHDEHVKRAEIEATNAFLAKFFAGARW